jgi:hypothetical protein
VAKKKKPRLPPHRLPPQRPLLLLTLLLPPQPPPPTPLPLLLRPRLLPLATRSNRFIDHAKATFGWLFSCAMPI